MNHRTRRALAAALLAIAAAGSLSATANAAATLEGTVSFTDSGGATTSGGSGDFSMSVPSGSACQGSGATGYRWETFLAGDDVAIGDVTFSSGPDPISGKFVAPLFDATGEQVSTKFPSNSPLGLISGIPSLSLAKTVAGLGLAGIPVGYYRIGIACTHLTAVQEYWATLIEVTSDGADSPLGIAWTVSAGPPASTTTTTTVDPTSTSIVDTTAPSSTDVTTSTDAAGSASSSTEPALAASGPVTGSSSLSMALLAAAVVLAGRFVILSARRVKVLPPA